MSRYSFKLPDLGEGTVESEIVKWHVQVGDDVSCEQPVVDVMTDKATIEITAPVNGRVVSLAAAPGEMVAVGAELVVFDTGDAQRPHAHAAADTLTGTPAAPPAEKGPPNNRAASGSSGSADTRSPGAAETRNKKSETSPAVRRMAREHGVDLRMVTGTGAKGRITRADIEAHLAAGESGTAHTTKDRRTGVETVRIVGLRRRIAEQVSISARQIPHFTYVEEVDVTELDALRAHLNETRGARQAKLSYLPFFMLALARVLPDHPQCNALFDDEQGIISRHAAIHIGIATQTEAGLVVPVVKHAEARDLWQCAAEMQRVTEAARDNTASKEDLTGSTITITSLGSLGGIVCTPIINHPEVAIVGINKVIERPVYRNHTLTPRLIMNISSSFDHRVVDGHDGASMIQSMKTLLEHPALLFI